MIHMLMFGEKIYWDDCVVSFVGVLHSTQNVEALHYRFWILCYHLNRLHYRLWTLHYHLEAFYYLVETHCSRWESVYYRLEALHYYLWPSVVGGEVKIAMHRSKCIFVVSSQARHFWFFSEL